MSLASVLLPVLVQVLLTYALLFGLIGLRAFARDPRAGSGWSAAAARCGASYGNQFEMPVLFFALVALAVAARVTDGPFVALEWVVVISRIAQAAIHVTINVVPLRAAAFVSGNIALGIAWIRVAIAVLGG